MQKQTNWRGRLLTCVLAAGMLMTSVPVYSGSVAVEAASETKTTKIDFSTMKNLDNLPDNWKIQNGSGNSQLVDDSENGKVLKLSKTNSGNEISLKNSKLDINNF